MAKDIMCPFCLKRPATFVIREDRFCGLCSGRVRGAENVLNRQADLKFAEAAKKAVYRVCEVLEQNELIPKEVYLLGSEEMNVIPMSDKDGRKMVGYLGFLLPDVNDWKETEERVPSDGRMMTSRVAIVMDGCTWPGRLQIRHLGKEK